MANKKYTALLGFLCLFASSSFAQEATGYDVQDSSLYPRKRLPQHNEYMSNAYPFPAKPRNQWEVGVKGGLFTVFGDVPAKTPTFGGAIHVRKALGYVVSLRGEFMYGVGKGLNWKQRTAGFSEAARLAGYGQAGAPYLFDNYRTVMKDLDLTAIISLRNILFHRAEVKWNMYAMAGVGVSWYNTKQNLLDANGNPYNFANAGITNPNSYSDRKETRKQLKDFMDDSYESAAETDGDARAKLGDNTLKPNGHVGLGFAYKLSKRINIAVEDKFTFVKSDDLVDGQRYQNVRTGNNSPFGGVLTPDYDTYNFLSVGLNFNIGGRSVEPLYWINPLVHPYNELNAPKHMKLPKPILDDADGDGVTDQFDLEPNTPQGAPVDSHGVAKDTDGDGVPDFKDKELITPTQCQPVDADGIGKCPEPPCCADLRNSGFTQRSACNIGDLPSITFKGRSVSLDNDAKAVLASVAEKIRNNADCKIAVIGYGESSKSAQQLSWDRVNAVINYLVEKEGISADRFIFKYGEGGGDPNTVDLRDGSAEEGPNAVPAPHPNLRKKG